VGIASRYDTIPSLAGAQLFCDLRGVLVLEISAPPLANDPQNADCWGRSRQIRPGLIAWLCMDDEARRYVHCRGIRVFAADITGTLGLSFATIPFQLSLQHCRLGGELDLRRAQVAQLDLDGSLIQKLYDDEANVTTQVYLRFGFTAFDQVRFLGRLSAMILATDPKTMSPHKPYRHRVQ